MEQKNYGFKIENVVIKPEDYVFGSNLPLDVLNEDGDWTEYLPLYEPQAEKFETWGCTVWGSQNGLEILHKFLYDSEPNYSERFNYIDAGITTGGGNPHNVLESIRNTGTVDQSVLPMTETYDEFVKPKPLTSDLIEKAKDFVAKYEFKHEWIIPSDPKKMKELIKSSLRYSPIDLSVTAWYQDSSGLYVDNNEPNNHWCVAFAYRDVPEGVILKVFDSYDHSVKELSSTHSVFCAKRIWLKKKSQEEVKKWWQINTLSELLKNIYSILSLQLRLLAIKVGFKKDGEIK